jgi:lipopolysaccharide export system protein LptA
MAGLAFLALIIVACVATARNGGEAADQPFAVRVVDDSVRGDAAEGPAGADRVHSATGNGPGALWLKREGQIVGNVVAEAHASVAPDGKPIVEFTWTPEGQAQFAALTRENIGRRLAVVVNGTVVSAPVVSTEITGGRGIIAGDFTEAQARALAAVMMGQNNTEGPGDVRFEPGDQSIAIHADSFAMDQNAGTATYSGTVVVVQGDVRISADTVTVSSTDGKVSRMEARGHVVVGSPAGTTNGDAAIYDVPQGNLQVTGQVILTKADSVMRGGAVVIDLTTGRATVTAPMVRPARVIPVAAAADQKIIERVVIEGTSRVAPAQVAALISPLRQGAVYDPVAADSSLKALFESGLFANVRFNFDPGTSTLNVRVVEK